MSEDIEQRLRRAAEALASYSTTNDGEAIDAINEAADRLAALSPPLELEGEREAIARIIADDVIPILCDAKERCNLVAAARQKIGPIATQGQTAAHSIARAIEWLSTPPLADAILSRRSTLPVGSQGVMASVAESTDEEPDGSLASEGQRKSERSAT